MQSSLRRVGRLVGGGWGRGEVRVVFHVPPRPVTDTTITRVLAQCKGWLVPPRAVCQLRLPMEVWACSRLVTASMRYSVF